MKGNTDTSYVHGLNRDAAMAILHKREGQCTLETVEKFLSLRSRLRCNCGRCLLNRSILRGRRLISTEKKSAFETLKEVSASPLALLQVIVSEGFKNIVVIVFFSFTVSLPLMGIHLLTTEVGHSKELPSGIDISEDQIAHIAAQAPELRVLSLSPPTNLRAIGPSLPELKVLPPAPPTHARVHW